ncbi:hypothetical protein C7450_103136 [Chelatococcus asaccharovorans]|uniref:Uncharacterized protein n=1 Tax=Chelatococcus asaccharovorans TaxID=28210 RepID=A0A2V3UB17_9HYPH|nr:hypothetical protein C7450_103136 [Chelatococcus asaccharovorans]
MTRTKLCLVWAGEALAFQSLILGLGCLVGLLAIALGA